MAEKEREVFGVEGNVLAIRLHHRALFSLILLIFHSSPSLNSKTHTFLYSASRTGLIGATIRLGIWVTAIFQPFFSTEKQSHFDLHLLFRRCEMRYSRGDGTKKSV